MAAGQKKEEEKYFREVVVRVPDSTIIAGAWTAQYTRLDHLREILLEDRGCCRDLSLLLVSVKGAEAGDQRAWDKFFICFGVLNVHTIISEDSKAWVQQCERHILQYELRIGLMCSTYKALQNSSVQGKVVKSIRTVFNFGQIQRTSEMTPCNQVWIEDLIAVAIRVSSQVHAMKMIRFTYNHKVRYQIWAILERFRRLGVHSVITCGPLSLCDYVWTEIFVALKFWISRVAWVMCNGHRRCLSDTAKIQINEAHRVACWPAIPEERSKGSLCLYLSVHWCFCKCWGRSS